MATQFGQEAENQLSKAASLASLPETQAQQAMAAAIVYALLDVARAIRSAS